MSENSRCVVCGSVMLGGYPGRPRLTCSATCKNARQVIRGRRASVVRSALGPGGYYFHDYSEEALNWGPDTMERGMANG